MQVLLSFFKIGTSEIWKALLTASQGPSGFQKFLSHLQPDEQPQKTLEKMRWFFMLSEELGEIKHLA
jgi:hypothetical protein